jgi:hypothetical protein
MELDLDDVWDNEIMTKFDTHWDYKHNEPKQKSILDSHPELRQQKQVNRENKLNPMQAGSNEAFNVAAFLHTADARVTKYLPSASVSHNSQGAGKGIKTRNSSNSGGCWSIFSCFNENPKPARNNFYHQVPSQTQRNSDE